MTDSAKQSNEVDLTARLIELIINMSEDQQRTLLSVLKKWQQRGRRKRSRKSCLISMDYVSQDRVFRGFIRNISVGGAFVETSVSPPVAQEIILAFSSPNYQTAIKTTGKVAWQGPQGFGVRFKMEKEKIESMIKAL